eukprot:gnl/Carplike_NY0171/2011_a2711_979.p1 GENE.gnl/Carplike_NY0171/2011_a2711_979~~gnl/Carplike_NY0171/2011_a2711_979.p1  ORF type:complete len:205 (+),score=51.47 gnl/Carplike_NY0171/2011_a2711_979:58-615(+)
MILKTIVKTKHSRTEGITRQSIEKNLVDMFDLDEETSVRYIRSNLKKLVVEELLEHPSAARFLLTPAGKDEYKSLMVKFEPEELVSKSSKTGGRNRKKSSKPEKFDKATLEFFAKKLDAEDSGHRKSRRSCAKQARLNLVKIGMDPTALRMKKKRMEEVKKAGKKPKKQVQQEKKNEEEKTTPEE